MKILIHIKLCESKTSQGGRRGVEEVVEGVIQIECLIGKRCLRGSGPEKPRGRDNKTQVWPR